MTPERSDADERRSRRCQSQVLFDELVAEYSARPGVTRGTMFGSEGVRHDGKFFAFVGGDGELIVKLPAERVSDLVASGAGEPVKPSRRVMREWVAVPPADWPTLLDEAFRFALQRAKTTR